MWHLRDDDVPVTRAADLIRERIARGELTTWLEHGAGPVLAVVTNGTRAMVMMLAEPGDSGGHAIDPDAAGQQDGYILENGQHDTYDDRDTVPLDTALRAVDHIVAHGRPPADLPWEDD